MEEKKISKEQIEKLIKLINELYMSKYIDHMKKYDINEEEVQKLIDRKNEIVRQHFTTGGCGVYARFLCDLLKEYDAKVVAYESHATVKVDDKLYDVNGYNPYETREILGNEEIMKRHVLDMNNESDREYLDFFMDMCNLTSSGGKRGDVEIYEQLLNEIKDEILGEKNGIINKI